MKGYRKFTVVLVALLFAFILALLRILSGGDFTVVVSVVVGAYKLSNMVADYANGHAQPPQS